jgi:hypothetical protein
MIQNDNFELAEELNQANLGRQEQIGSLKSQIELLQLKIGAPEASNEPSFTHIPN